ncbi:AEC family transporter [Enterocloster bolteae]|uniref:AEC family transporter n=1 Tax=Enterocloster bolteae TaxID=208479 RepID=UPI002676C08A|nr:AEC family transporter [Enterocloster bolteae]
MESFLRMLNAQMILLVYLAVGMYCMKVGLIDRDSKEKLVDIILRITLPCMIFNSFNKPLTPEVMKQTALILVVAVSISILSFFLGKVIYNKYPQKKKSILQYCTLVNNSGFLGMPMVSAVYGSEGLFAASIFIIPNRIFMWTAGLAMFTTADFRTKCKNILLNPCIVTVFLGIARRITGFPVPEFLDTAIANTGAVTTPLSMMVIGTMLIGVPWKKLLEPSIFRLAFVRLIALPLVALYILNLIDAQPLLAGVSLILTGMPAGSTSALLAAKYGADEDYASRCIVTTTIMSLATIPVLMLFLK